MHTQNVPCQVPMIFSGIFSALLIIRQKINTNDNLVSDTLTFDLFTLKPC